MNNSIIEGLTEQEKTLFLNLINKILAQKLLPEASSTSTEKQFKLNFKVDENNSIDVDSIQLQLLQIKPPSLFEKSSTSTEKQLQSKLNIEKDENSSTEIDSINVKSEQPKFPSPILSTIFYVISFAALTLGFIAIPGIIIWIVTNSVKFTILGLIGWLIVSFLGVLAFFGKFNWTWLVGASTAYVIILSLVTLLQKLLSLSTR